MAGRANARRVAMIHREPCVIECGACPGGRRVAGLAGGREARRDVVRICRPRIIHPVAGVAVGGRPGENVVDVATVAGHRDMRAGQGEWRIVMVEGRSRPACRVVADGAVRGESRRHVAGVIGVVEIRLVATEAGRIGAGQVVVIVDVALLAGQ